MPCHDYDSFTPVYWSNCRFCGAGPRPKEKQRQCTECGGGCFACVTEQCSCCGRWFCIGCMEEDRRCGECVKANKEEECDGNLQRMQ